MQTHNLTTSIFPEKGAIDMFFPLFHFRGRAIQVPDLGLDRVMVYKLDHGSMSPAEHVELDVEQGWTVFV